MSVDAELLSRTVTVELQTALINPRKPMEHHAYLTERAASAIIFAAAEVYAVHYRPGSEMDPPGIDGTIEAHAIEMGVSA